MKVEGNVRYAATNTSLTIFNVTSEDGGTYKCADNEQKLIVIEFKQTPTMDNPSIRANDVVELACRFSFYSSDEERPILKWKHSWAVINLGSKLYTRETNDSNGLLIQVDSLSCFTLSQDYNDTKVACQAADQNGRVILSTDVEIHISDSSWHLIVMLLSLFLILLIVFKCCNPRRAASLIHREEKSNLNNLRHATDKSTGTLERTVNRFDKDCESLLTRKQGVKKQTPKRKNSNVKEMNV